MPLDFWTFYWPFVAFVFGAIVGSFLNVCIWRLPRGESLSEAPSHCPACMHRLGFWPDMVPMISQIRYRSRCRYCGEPFSWRYFWVELITAVAFTLIYIRYVHFGPADLSEAQRTWSALMGMIFTAALITVFFIDLDTYQIPDGAIWVAGLAAVSKDLFLIGTGGRDLWQSIPGLPWQVPIPASVLCGLVAFWLLWQFAALGTAILGREAMGAGDSLLLGAMGAFLIPWPLCIVAFLVAVFFGAVGGMAGVWLAGREPAAQRGVEGPEGLEPNLSPGLPPPEFVEVGAAGPDGAERPDALTAHRGAAGLPADDDEEPAAPPVPVQSRWGRAWTVLGTWAAVGAVWAGAAAAGGSLATGLAIGAVGLIAAAGLLWFGVRAWVAGDRAWLAEMEEFFEGDPGPRFIPFGPYLVAGTFIAMMVGRPIVQWYALNQLGIDLSGWGWD
jgi:leader peptidase (prepilin peptidase)/N-methyltransferase